MPKTKLPKPPEGMLAIPAASNALDVPSVYANSVELLSMNWIDARIAFNEIVVETGNNVRVQRRANIVMPAAAFKTMVQVLMVNAARLAASEKQQAEHAQALIQAHLEVGNQGVKQ